MALKTDNDKQDEGGSNDIKTSDNAINEKVMANSPGNMPGRTVNPVIKTMNGNRNSPIEAYFEFPSSKTESHETYPNRVEKIASFLGNKDEVKG